jgi:hypothetical protein
MADEIGLIQGITSADEAASKILDTRLEQDDRLQEDKKRYEARHVLRTVLGSVPTHSINPTSEAVQRAAEATGNANDDSHFSVSDKGILSYKRSSDFEKGKRGIEAVVVRTKDALLRAGVKSELVDTVMGNMMNQRELEEGRTRLIVVKTADDRAAYVLTGYTSERPSAKMTDNNISYSIYRTLDLREPSKPRHLDKEIEIEFPNYNLTHKAVDDIEVAMKDPNKFGMAQPTKSGILLADSNVRHSDVVAPTTPTSKSTKGTSTSIE